MTELNLSGPEIEQLMEVLGKVKKSKAYQNYEAGVRVVSKRAASLKGEGDAFARIGETLRSGKVPQFLSATAKGQKKVEETLLAELKQQKLHGLLKNEEFKDAVYREMYVEPGTIGQFLGIVSEEENMSDNNGNVTEEGNNEMFDRPEYDSEFYESDAVKALNLGERISAEDKKKLEALYETYKEGKANGGQSQQGEENAAGGAAAEGAGTGTGNGEEEDNAGSGDAVEVNAMEGEGPRTDEHEDAEWVTKYNAALTKWGKENNNEWTRDNEPDENGNRPDGLKGNLADGTEIHYTAPDKLSVKAPEGQEISAEHFKAVIAMAKENDQDIKLGTTMSPAFKAALIEACAKGGVAMQGLSEEDQAAYDSFKPKTQTQTEEKTEEHVEYKLNPVIAKGRLVEYSGRVYSADHYSQRAVNAGNDEFDTEIAKMEENLAKGWYKATGEDKARAEILLKKYARAEHKKDTEMMAVYETALQRYGIDSIAREPEENGSFVVKGKPYAERSDEEKAKINEATEKAFPVLTRDGGARIGEASKPCYYDDRSR